MRRALDDGGLEAKGALCHQLKLCDQVIKAVCWSADDTVLTADEGKQAGQFDVAEGVYFVEHMVVGHWVGDDVRLIVPLSVGAFRQRSAIVGSGSAIVSLDDQRP